MNGKFPPDVIAAAQASQARWGCPASVCLAQWALESAWGKRQSGRNNPFGIKAKPGEPATPRMTWEVNPHGQRYEVVQNFRDFTSMTDAFDGHGRLLATGRAYELARACKNDPKAYARAMTGHYATDPDYGRKLIAIMDANGLYAFDTPILQPPIAREPPVVVAKPKTAAKAAAGAAVVVAGTTAVAAAPHDHVAMWALFCVAVIALVLFLIIHFRKV